MGLHRSGTTFLYDALARRFGLAALRVDHILRYPRLLAAEAGGRTAAERAALDRRLVRLGATREVDEIPLSHAMVEEYGFLLARIEGDTRLTAGTLPRFLEMSRKILALEPHAPGVVLKNPWDTGRAAEVLRLVPGSRFVFIARDPLRILHSQLASARIFGSRRARYLDLLLEGIPAGRLLIGAQRLLHHVAGPTAYGRVMIRLLMPDIARQLVLYRASLDAVPPDTRIEVRYDDLTAHPAETLARIGSFLGLAPATSLEAIEPRVRRGPLDPEVERWREPFRRRLERLGVATP